MESPAVSATLVPAPTGREDAPAAASAEGAPAAATAASAPATHPRKLDLRGLEPPRQLSEARLEDLTIDGICGVY